jgi:uncharacterized protein YjbJ (UPF0337 family)
MISQIYQSLLTIGLMSFLSLVLVFGISVENSWAEQAFTRLFKSPHISIASIERVKATAKDLEGKTQEAIGNVMGNTQNQIAGKAKQAEADVRNATEDIRDKVKLPERVKAAAKNMEGKTQEAIGNVTGDRRDKVAGKAKQMESQTRNLVEDAKDKLKGMLE